MSGAIKIITDPLAKVYLRLKDNPAQVAKLIPLNTKGDFLTVSTGTIAKLWILASFYEIDSKIKVLELIVRDKNAIAAMRGGDKDLTTKLGISKEVVPLFNASISCKRSFEDFLRILRDEWGYSIPEGFSYNMPDLADEWWVDLMEEHLGLPNAEEVRGALRSSPDEADASLTMHSNGDLDVTPTETIDAVRNELMDSLMVRTDLLKEYEDLKSDLAKELRYQEELKKAVDDLRKQKKQAEANRRRMFDFIISNAEQMGPDEAGPAACLSYTAVYNLLVAEKHQFPESMEDMPGVHFTIARINTMFATMLVKSANYNTKDVSIRTAISNEEMITKIKEIVSTPESLGLQINHIGETLTAMNNLIKSMPSRSFGAGTVAPIAPQGAAPAPKTTTRIKKPSEMTEEERKAYNARFAKKQ